MSERRTGRVVTAHGRHCLVESDNGQRVLCHPRGKKNAVVVGDTVQWTRSGDEGLIEQVDPRRNLLYRQDELRTKSFAANVDQVLVLLAADPVYSDMQLARALIAAEAAQIDAVVALNKHDLREAFDSAWSRLAPLRRMGLSVLAVGLRDGHGLDELVARLRGRSTLVLGPSGVGKSTLVNQLVPDAGAQTGEVSQALNSGRHTTTSTTWYWTDPSRTTALIDSPGFQSFGLFHIDATELAGLMPDLRAALGQCRFYNCTHRHEPGCGVRTHVGADPADDPLAIDETRYRLYTELFDELAAKPAY
ncbi:MAG: ribosome small subunit-dependent GTPase A [Hydrogenophaga sp.]|uniref:ribosome small subunit-dependent GTPase A n=1 Tax=Hydrogenophaga sp. TaxID=1904254 RepID=UPI001DC7C8DB|nr:ribosome small subunit-dependent GTPase A [Hydrogenophaga sp.]MBX3610027.1 ribosome small subunit-dependent GTPase A [Hydrogenophaga sp.]